MIGQRTPTPPTSFAYSSTEYQDEHGRRVVHRTVAFGTPPPQFKAFVGINQLLVEFNTPQGVHREPSPYVFPISDATSLEDAFVKWDAVAAEYGKQHSDRLRAQYEQPAGGIAIPTPADVQRIIKG